MRKILLIIFILVFVTSSRSQVQEVWSVPFSYVNGSRDKVSTNAVDADGNVYVGGASSGDYMSIVKYDKYGAEKWRRVLGGGDHDFHLRVVKIVLHGDHVYVLGTTDNFDNIFVTVKYHTNGTFRWLRRFVGFESEHKRNGEATDMAVDASGNVYVTGFVIFSVFGNPDSGTYGEYVTIKYDGEGDFKWLKRYNGTSPGNGHNKARGIAVDASGNAYVTGYSQLDGEMDIATIKYSSATGSELWIKRYNTTAGCSSFGNDIAVDADNNIYVTGTEVTSSVDVRKTITTKIDPDGNEIWAQTNPGGTGVIIKISGDGYVHVGSDDNYSTGYPHAFKIIKYNAAGTSLWINTYIEDATASIQINDFAFDIDNNVYVVGGSATNSEGMVIMKYRKDNGSRSWTKTVDDIHISSGNTETLGAGIGVDANYNVYVSAGGLDPQVAGQDDDFLTIRYSQCNIICPANITVNNDPGKCDAVVTFADVTFTGDCGPTLTYTHASGATFPVGTTTVTVTSDETGATCSFTITVVDNELPVLTCPVNKTVNMNAGVCYATASAVNAGTATATDNCSLTVVGVRSDGKLLTDNYPGGTTTITWTANDGTNSVSCTQTITVVDNEPPVITGESASTYVLSPPNHTMRDVTINYNTPTDNCSVTWEIKVESNEAVNGTGDGDTDPDHIVIDDHHVKLRAERAANGTGRTYTITITATDGAGNTAVKTVEVKVPHNIKNPHSGQAFKVGSTVSFEGEFWDKPGNKHTAKWLIDGTTTAKASVTEPAGNKNGKVTGSYKFTTPGVYKLQMNITDQTGLTTTTNTAADLEAIVVIYDPNGGHTYGGGYYNSPAGALLSDPASTGKANYGFAMNYFKNSTFPKGETQFEFKVGSFEFNALNFDYLVISNSMAQFKGTGKIIGGQSGIGFTMTVTDGQLDGTGVDKIRMKIYNKNNGTIIYDNQPGASDAALPIQAVGTNSIVVISSNNNPNITKSGTTQKTEMEATAPEVSNGLDVIAFPNPSTNNFSITVKGNSKEKVVMQVVDMYGRMIETRNVSANSIIRFGDRYKAGTYFVRILQGKRQKEIKLIKLSD